MHKITIKKIKDENVITKKEAKKELKTIRVMNFNNFYEKYMKGEKQTPFEYITIVNRQIMMLYYHYKYDIYDTDYEKAKSLKEILKKIDYNNYINIYVETSEPKLNALKIKDSMEYNIKKLYEVLHWLTIEMGIKVKMDHTLVEIRNAGWSFNPNRIQAINNDRIYAIRDGQIIEACNDSITPRDELKGSTIMMEIKMNQFINIPYLYYERLYNIKEYELSYNLFSMPVEESDDPYRDRLEIGKRSFVANDNLQRVLLYNLNLSHLGYDFDDIGSYEIGTYLGYDEINHKIVTRDGKIKNLNDVQFSNKYLKFLNY